jgi:hypothetical protein
MAGLLWLVLALGEIPRGRQNQKSTQYNKKIERAPFPFHDDFFLYRTTTGYLTE